MTDYHQNGIFKGILGYAYDKNGNEILQEWYNSQDQLFVFYKKYYNSRNEEILIEKFEVVKGDTVLTSTSTIEYLYGDYGNQSQVTNKTGGKAYIKKVIVSYPEEK